MKYKLYTTSEKAWDAMINAIDQAKESIYMEMYIFLDDTSASHDFIGKLKQKAREGIRVVIVVDAFGSQNLKKESIASIREAGAELLFFSDWLRHIHRKILIVDEKIAFVGGVNIGKKFTHWNDMQLKIQSRMAKTFLKSFAYTYAMAGGRSEKILIYRDKLLRTKFRFWIMEHSPFRNIYSLKEQYREKISGAKNSIRIVTPYFIPPRWLIALLDNAIQRNVKVEIIVPKSTDLPFINRINHRFIHDLSLLGISFFLTQQMTHAKILIIDGEEALVGSQNIDFLSFQINAETGVFFREKNLIREIQEIIDNWKKDAEQFKLLKYKMKFIDYIILLLLRLFSPIL